MVDTSEPTLSLDEIRSIAAELDLTPEAVEAAIREMEQEPRIEQARTRGAGDIPWLALSLIAGAAGSVAITFAGKYGGLDSLITTTMFASVSVATVNMWCASRLKGRLRYLTFNASTTLAWLAVGVAVAPLIVDLAPAVFGGGAALGGSMILALRDWRRISKARSEGLAPLSKVRQRARSTDEGLMRVSLRLRSV